MMNVKYVQLIIVLMLSVACNTVKKSSNSTDVYKTTYRQSIDDAMVPESSEINHNLVFINHENDQLIWKTINGEQYLLVVSWSKEKKYYESFIDSLFYNTQLHSIWVTTAPELLQRMRNSEKQNADLRLEQMLGLPPNYGCRYFVEFWVRPSDLFRPCPDPEIDDSECGFCFSSTTDSTHIKWMNEHRIDLYYECELYDKYPWTQLGYTYDWNPKNKNHIGLSEFVIKQNANIVVNAIYMTENYLKKSSVIK